MVDLGLSVQCQTINHNIWKTTLLCMIVKRDKTSLSACIWWSADEKYIYPLLTFADKAATIIWRLIAWRFIILFLFRLVKTKWTKAVERKSDTVAQKFKSDLIRDGLSIVNSDFNAPWDYGNILQERGTKPHTMRGCQGHPTYGLEWQKVPNPPTQGGYILNIYWL